MASYTPNINLKKPADGDAYDIADANGNMDAIDTAIGSLRESVSRFVLERGAVDITKVRFQIGNSYLNIMMNEDGHNYYSIRIGRNSKAMQVVHTSYGVDTVIWSL